MDLMALNLHRQTDIFERKDNEDGPLFRARNYRIIMTIGPMFNALFNLGLPLFLPLIFNFSHSSCHPKIAYSDMVGNSQVSQILQYIATFI